VTYKLTNRVVWITGCDTGVGRELALGFSRNGATVIATCLTDALQTGSFEAELRNNSETSRVLQQDVTCDEHAQSVAEHIEKLGAKKIVLINNAGIYPRVPADELTNTDWRQLMAVNLDGAWYSSNAVIPLMKKLGYGKIIQIGSITATLGVEHLTHYIASKLGVIGMTRGLARDLGRYGIRSNCVVLGAIRVAAEAALGDPDVIDAKVFAHQCLTERLEPRDVLPTFMFLASADSDPITGQVITIDAGWSHST